jgi:hypothetical protein
MEEIIDAYSLLILAGLVLLLIWIALMIGLWVKVNRLRRNYLRMMNAQGLAGIEEVLIGIHRDLEQLKEDRDLFKTRLDQISDRLSKIKGRIGFHRYNAFSSPNGSDLSFSMAIISEKQDGVVISGLHARDETYVYAKPIQNGKSNYALTPEEIKAIHLAMEKE